MAYESSSVELDLVNDVLYNTGESLVNSLEGGPNISQIRFALEQEKKRLLENKGQGWTWNVTKLNLTPDSSGYYRVDGDIILAIISRYPTYRPIKGILTDLKTNSRTNLDVSDIQAAIDLDYEDLPMAARIYLSSMVSYREAVAQEFSQTSRDNLLQNAFQHLSDLREQEIYTMQADGSFAVLDNLNTFDPLTIVGNMAKV